jgi:hypothetical protein
MAKLNSIIYSTPRAHGRQRRRARAYASSFCGKFLLDTILEDGAEFQLEIDPHDPAIWRALADAMASAQLGPCPACGSDVDILDHCTSLKTARCK